MNNVVATNNTNDLANFFAKKQGVCAKNAHTPTILLFYFHGSHHFIDLRNFEQQYRNYHANNRVGQHINTVVANGVEHGAAHP